MERAMFFSFMMRPSSSMLLPPYLIKDFIKGGDLAGRQDGERDVLLLHHEA